MALGETNVSKIIELFSSKIGFTMLRNNTGMFLTLDGQRKTMAGLGKGTSDLIGWREVEITPDMVGKKVAVFTAFEVKTEKGAVRPEQKKFIDLVTRCGGIARIMRRKSDLEEFGLDGSK